MVKVADGLMVAVGAVWGIVALAGLFDPALRDPMMHLPFAAICGAYYGRRGNDKREGAKL